MFFLTFCEDQRYLLQEVIEHFKLENCRGCKEVGEICAILDQNTKKSLHLRQKVFQKEEIKKLLCSKKVLEQIFENGDTKGLEILHGIFKIIHPEQRQNFVPIGMEMFLISYSITTYIWYFATRGTK